MPQLKRTIDPSTVKSSTKTFAKNTSATPTAGSCRRRSWPSSTTVSISSDASVGSFLNTRDLPLLLRLRLGLLQRLLPGIHPAANDVAAGHSSTESVEV